MSSPRPTRPPTKGPNPFLLLGIFVAGSATFLIMSERRSRDPAHSRKEFPNPLLPSYGGEKVDMPERKPR
ncbi:uncharacterized protein EHS24_009263 [Apiotrichum porosum]|uniref:Uncharacterized protein n=1 Tax=Apiotrichum porosum TaxID=105984 RepID=A0A427XLF0_9TREE|nr:uncharacterized protein EHS24_009263 [Apiotrichum porosum]RSH79612.1 hypothetical protein EHS24_009263 [Apiotrichum porosum]